jgi:polar amino acid transport system substrate-binding protein
MNVLKILLFLSLLFPMIAWGDHDLDLNVNYRYNNTLVTVKGRHTEMGYVFGDIQQTKSVVISTLDWQPYIGEHMCQQGWVQQLTIALLHSQGYRVTAQFRPWARAVKEVESGEADILYPEYNISPEAPSDVFADTLRMDHLALSAPFPGGIVALIKRKEDPFLFEGDLEPLKGKVVGVVRGYENTPEFDAMMDKGLITAVEALDDLQLGRMLLAKRVDLIVGDPKVIFYRLSQAESPFDLQNNVMAKLQVLDPPLAYNELYYAISKKRDKWQTLLADINAALAEFKQRGVLEQLIKDTLQRCGYNTVVDLY